MTEHHTDFMLPHQTPYGRQMMGYDGDNFQVVSIDGARRLIPSVIPTPFNYKNAYHRIGSNLNAAAGWDDLTLIAPGANEVLVITTMYAYDATTNITEIMVGMITGATTYNVQWIAPTAIGQPCRWSGVMICEAGYAPWAGFAGTAAGDDIWFYATGYVMRTAW